MDIHSERQEMITIVLEEEKMKILKLIKLNSLELTLVEKYIN